MLLVSQSTMDPDLCYEIQTITLIAQKELNTLVGDMEDLFAVPQNALDARWKKAHLHTFNRELRSICETLSAVAVLSCPTAQDTWRTYKLFQSECLVKDDTAPWNSVEQIQAAYKKWTRPVGYKHIPQTTLEVYINISDTHKLRPEIA